MANITISSFVIPNYQGPTTVQLEIYASENFLASDGTLISASNPTDRLYYKIFTCTVNAGSKTLTINSGTLPSTTDGRDRQTARYAAYFVNTSTLEIVDLFLSDFRLDALPLTQTWDEVITFNAPGAIFPIDLEAYTKSQVNQLIQELRDNLMIDGVVTPVAGGTGIPVTNQSGFLVAASGIFSLRAITDADIPDTITVSNYQLLSQKGQANGYASLDGTTLVPVAQIPNLQNLNGLLDAGGGGTGNAFFQVSGPGTSIKTYTFPDATCTVLTTNAPVSIVQGGLGITTVPAAGEILLGNGTGYSLTRTPAVGSITTDDQNGVVIGPYGAGAGETGELRFLELTGGNYFGMKAPDSITANRILVWPSADPLMGQVLTAGAPAGSIITLSWSTPAAPAGGYNLIQVDGVSLSANTTVNFLGAAADGTIGGVGPFVGDTLGAVERIAIRTSPDNSTVLVGVDRTITAGVGLSGGGDLSDDRTLAVVADTTNQQVQVKDNAGTIIGTRRAVRFNNTATLEFTLVDNGSDTVAVTGDVMTSSSDHDFLSATHPDVVPSSPVRGGVIVGNASPAWEQLTPTTNRVLLNDGTDTVFGQVVLTTMVSGTLPLANGGLGQDASGVLNGQIPIGNDAGNSFSLATITAGSGISVVNGAGSITISATGSAGITDVTTDDTDFFTITDPDPSTTKINLTINPGTNASGQASLIFPNIPASTQVTSGIPTKNVVHLERIYIPTKISFNVFAFSVTVAASSPGGTITQQGTASIAIYKADGTVVGGQPLVNSGGILTTTAGIKFNGSPLTGSAVSGGIATLQPGHYLLAFTHCAIRNSIGTEGNAAQIMVSSFTATFFLTSLHNTGTVTHPTGGASTAGVFPATNLTLTSTGGATVLIPIIKLALA